MKMDRLIAFHRTFGSCVLGPPEKNYFFAVPRRGSLGRILTMQLEPPKDVRPSTFVKLQWFGGVNRVWVVCFPHSLPIDFDLLLLWMSFIGPPLSTILHHEGMIEQLNSSSSRL